MGFILGCWSLLQFYLKRLQISKTSQKDELAARADEGGEKVTELTVHGNVLRWPLSLRPDSRGKRSSQTTAGDAALVARGPLGTQQAVLPQSQQPGTQWPVHQPSGSYRNEAASGQVPCQLPGGTVAQESGTFEGRSFGWMEKSGRQTQFLRSDFFPLNLLSGKINGHWGWGREVNAGRALCLWSLIL